MSPAYCGRARLCSSIAPPPRDLCTRDEHFSIECTKLYSPWYLPHDYARLRHKQTMILGGERRIASACQTIAPGSVNYLNNAHWWSNCAHAQCMQCSARAQTAVLWRLLVQCPLKCTANYDSISRLRSFSGKNSTLSLLYPPTIISFLGGTIAAKQYSFLFLFS